MKKFWEPVSFRFRSQKRLCKAADLFTNVPKTPEARDAWLHSQTNLQTRKQQTHGWA